MISVNGERLLARINELGAIGKDAEGRRTRLAASDTEKQGRDLVSKWMKEAGLEVVVDRIGNIFGTKYKSKAELAGGIILILLGLKILLEHLGIL